MKDCIVCKSETKYSCVRCDKPVCKKSKECSVFVDEDFHGWKAGVCVALCNDCTLKVKLLERVN